MAMSFIQVKRSFEWKMILSKEQEKLLAEIAATTVYQYDELKRAFENACFQLLDISEGLKEIAKNVFEVIKNYSLLIEDKPSLDTPKKIMLKSQVHFNRPFLARARSNC
jgi:hypothetical protein